MPCWKSMHMTERCSFEGDLILQKEKIKVDYRYGRHIVLLTHAWVGVVAKFQFLWIHVDNDDFLSVLMNGSSTEGKKSMRVFLRQLRCCLNQLKEWRSNQAKNLLSCTRFDCWQWCMVFYGGIVFRWSFMHSTLKSLVAERKQWTLRDKKNILQPESSSMFQILRVRQCWCWNYGKGRS